MWNGENTMPFSPMFSLKQKKAGHPLTATDLEVGVRGRVEGEVAEEGTVTVNAKKLYEINREVSHDQSSTQALRK